MGRVYKMIENLSLFFLFRYATDVYYYYKLRNISKKQEKVKNEIKKKIYDLDINFTNIQNIMFRNNGEDWKSKWDYFDEIKTKNYLFSTILEDNVIGKPKERFNIKKKNHSNLKRLDNNLNLLKSLTRKLSVDISNEDLGNLNFCLDSIKCNYRNPNVKVRWPQIDGLQFKPTKQTKTKKSTLYMNEIYSKIEKYTPQYTPIPKGRILGKESKWKTNFNRKKLKISGKYNRLIDLNCEFATTRPSLNNLLKKSKKSKRKKRFSIDCFVYNEIDRNSKNTIENFSDNNLSVYGYDLENDKLFYNQDNFVTDIFSSYFDPKKTPPTNPKQIFKKLEKDDGILLSDIKKDLNFDRKYLKKLEKNDLIYVVSNDHCIIPKY